MEARRAITVEPGGNVGGPNFGGAAMARKTRSKKPSRQGPRGQRGQRGPRGLTGERGERGERGAAGDAGQPDARLASILLRVTQELEGVQKTLQVQFTRIAELQADLDDIRK